MSKIIPPFPLNASPGSSLLSKWYEDLRNLLNTGTISQLWSSIDFSGSNITDIVSRVHNNLQSLQGGAAGEYYHLTSAQNTQVSVAVGGTYTPTLTNVTNLTASTTHLFQYLRVGATVTVSGKLEIDPTAAGPIELGISLPVASNFGGLPNCAGVGTSVVAGDGSLWIEADAANDRAALKTSAIDLTNHSVYVTFTYTVI